MANMPTRNSATTSQNNGSTNATFDISAIPTGDWIILQAQAGTTGVTFTLNATSGTWTELFPKNSAMGSRQVSLWAKIKVASDTNPTLTKSGSTNAKYILATGSGADAVANWVIGAYTKRSGTATDQYYTRALTITTTKDNSLGLAFSYEVTNAAEGTPPVTSGTGWTNWAYAVDDGTNVEQLRIAYASWPTAGTATSEERDTYANPQLTNAAGIQIALPPIPVPTAAFAHSEAGAVSNVDATGSSAVSPATITSYDWNWGDGSAHGSGATASHTYGSAGTFTITLTVTDSAGRTATITHSVSVSSTNLNPVAAFTAVATGMSVAVTDASTDPDGTVASYDWDWGDGSAHSTGKTPAAHVYTTSGSKTVLLTVTDNGGATNAVSHAVAVNNFGRDVKYVDGTGAVKAAKLFYFDGTTKKDLDLGTMVRTFNPMTVSRFLNFAQTGPWEAAHRGGSWNWPEETLFGYRAATDLGVMAIEISCQMSADGTWWAFHDAALDRTVLSGNPSTSTLPIASMTDAQIAAYNNLGTTAAGNTGQPARPVAKVVDIINAHYKTHVIIIEDKTYTHPVQMLNLMDSYGTSGRPASEIFIWKVTSSSGKVTFYDQPHARGYKTWGYIFDSSMSTEFPALASSGKSDMIGLDYNSSDATLSSAIALLKANGVKPTGHIINSTTQRDRMLALGCEGLMYSNVYVIPKKH